MRVEKAVTVNRPGLKVLVGEEGWASQADTGLVLHAADTTESGHRRYSYEP